MIHELIRRQRIVALTLTALCLLVLSFDGPLAAGPTDDPDADGLQNQFEDANGDLDGDETTNPGPDSDGNTTPDYLDPDDDGDGIATVAENADPNGDGNPSDAVDSDFDRQPDYLDPATIRTTPEVATELEIGNGNGGLSATLDNNDAFGFDVTTLGDLDGDDVVDIAVGAVFDDDGGVNRGAVHILFLNADGSVKAEQKISDLDGGLGATLDDDDNFGSSVAAIGDLDGDGIVDLAVGARQDADGGIGSGAIHVLFLNANGTVKAEQKISQLSGGLSATLADNGWFGSRSAELGDLDGDGVPDLAVGANRSSAIHILFLNPNGTVKAEQEISTGVGGLASDVSGTWFGTDIGSIGDLDGDGIGDLAVGSLNDDDGGRNAGAVHILFMDSNGTVKAEQKISALTAGLSPGPRANDNFGSAVAALGDLTGDGSTFLAVGAAFADGGGTARGEVYLLSLDTDGSVLSSDRISAVDGGLTDPLGDYFEFGSAITSVGDLDGDGTIGLAVGAYGDNDGAGFYQGAVHVLDLLPVTTVTVNTTGDGSDTNPGDAICSTGGVSANGDPECTLRAAIEEANTSPQISTIDFSIPDSDPNHLYHRDDAIPGSLDTPAATTLDNDSIADFDPDYPIAPFSWWHIAISSNLPDISGGITIDGTTQPGWQPNTTTGGAPTDAILPIVITSDGNWIMNLEGSGSTLRGLNLSATGPAGTMLYVNGDGSHTVEGSWFMVDPLGIANGTGDDGIWVVTLTTDNVIGGPDPEDHLLIGNGFSNSALTVISDSSTVQNVWIGAKATGDEPLPGYNDIPFYVSGNDNVIGGPDAGVIVSSSLNDILILEGDRNTVQGSSFGFLPDGTPSASEVSVVTGDDNMIGGTAVGEGNRFHGGSAGRLLHVEGGSGNSVLGSTFIGSTGVNIDVGPDGHNVNDPGDGDVGDNDLINHPELRSVATSGGLTTVGFDLDTPAGTYRVELFADISQPRNPTGYGAGEALVAVTSVVHTGTGIESFEATIPNSGGYWLSATATEDLGGGDFGSTSEFGAAIHVVDVSTDGIMTVNSTEDTGDAFVGDGICDTGAVNSVGDTECTLRAAVQEANAGAHIDAVHFDMPATEAGHSAGVWTIAPQPSLPDITERLSIDGSTQPGHRANGARAPLPFDQLPVVQLIGAGPNTGDGLHLAAGASGSTVHALTIGGFLTRDGYGIEVNADDVTITGSVIGLHADGTTSNGNAYGIVIDAFGAVIGGNDPADRNIVAGEQDAQIRIVGGGDIQMLGNIVGANADVTEVPGSYGSAIQLFDSDSIVVGTTAAPNVIAAPLSDFGLQTTSSNVAVTGNIFGTDATHTAELGSGSEAISVSGSDTLIVGNLIASSEIGIRVNGANTVVQGNWIGTDPTGSIDLGMTQEGIAVTANAVGVTIGGTRSGEGNTIAFAGAAGVAIRNPVTNPTVIGNTIALNAGPGIDHDDDGITPNDSPDLDGVPNFPTISSAEASGSLVNLTFGLDTAAGTHRIEVFSNTSQGPTGHGEGEALLAIFTIEHAGGFQEFDVNFEGAADQLLSLTSTPLLGDDTFGGTSEFSPLFTVVASPAPDPTPAPLPAQPVPVPTPPAAPTELPTVSTTVAPQAPPTTVESQPPSPAEPEPAPASIAPADEPVALAATDPSPSGGHGAATLESSEAALRDLSAGTRLDLNDEVEELSLRSFLAPIFIIGHLRLPLQQVLPAVALAALGAQLLMMMFRDLRVVRVAGASRYGALTAQPASDVTLLPPNARLLWARRRWRPSLRGTVELDTPVGRAIVTEDDTITM